MFELFLNPANMIIGGALISSPIIIHLINRLRFKRIRWAAMEFLLKSQKRNRRRLIIEQLILLMLRILLVLLAGLLLARFLGFSFANIFKPRNGLHVVILDDRLSMNDFWKAENGQKKNCFAVGKQLIEQDIAKKIVLARSPQQLVIRRLSDAEGGSSGQNQPGVEAQPKAFDFDRRLNDDSLKELHDVLNRMDGCTKLHLNLIQGVAEAAQIFANHTDDDCYLYLVSDFRQRHWAEPEATALGNKLKELDSKRVKIKLIDTANPKRGSNPRVAPLYHDNLAIMDLRPETRIAPEGLPVQFTVTVANFSPSDRKAVRVTIKVDGIERPEGSLTILNVPAGKTDVEQAFLVGFVRPAGLPPGQPYFAHITANLENEDAGLQADNIRYAVVEVRRQVPVLLVDGDLSTGDKPGGDTFHLRALFTSARGFEVRARGMTELELPNLDQYPSIYLLNVRDLSDKALKNLQAYIQNGGSVCFFLGSRVNPEYYNKKLYAGGKGIFPAPLADRPSPELSEEEKRDKELQNLLEPQYQIYIRDPQHPIFKEIYKYRSLFKLVNIERHYPLARAKWNDEAGRAARKAHQVEELATLPNDRPVSDYEAAIKSLLKQLPGNDPKYQPGLKAHQQAVETALAGKSVQALANALEELLSDPGKTNDPQNPNLKEFWEQSDPRIQDLRTRIEQMRDTVALGDPLVIVGRYGKGRTVVFFTTAGTNSRWNEWAGGCLGSPSYPVVMMELQKYLTSLDVRENLTVGWTTPLSFQLDPARYEAKMARYRQLEGKDMGSGKPAADKDAPAERADLQNLGQQSGQEKGGQITFTFDEAREPGVYLFELSQQTEPGTPAKKEWRAYAFNVDARNESDLKRATTPELEKATTGIVAGPGDDFAPRNRQTDLSENPLLYLVFLVILLAEQAMAVHLSFHLRGNEAQLPAQAVRPQAAA